MEPILVSAGLVALAEIGDKTQLLAIILAAKLRKPLPIILGILAATMFNHAAAATQGYLISEWLTGRFFPNDHRGRFYLDRWLGPHPRQGRRGGAANKKPRYGVFLTTVVTFSSSKSATRRRSRRDSWRLASKTSR